MFGKYLPSKLYSVHQKIPRENNDFFRRSLRVSNQQYKGGKIKKEGKSNGSRPWLMTHRNWLCGVVLRREAVRDLYSSSCKGFSPAHRGRQFRFVLLGIVFSFFWLAVVPPEESFSLHLSRETVNGIWRVRRSIEQVVQCFVSWSGGDGDGGGEEDTGVASPSLLGICGQGGIQLMVITSSQPAVFFCREPSSALLSLSSSLFPSLPHSQHLASRCL